MSKFNMGPGLMAHFSDYIPSSLHDHAMVVVTDHRVKKIYGEAIISNLMQSGFSTDLFSFPAGERFKTRKTKENIENFLLHKNKDRKTCLIALGGGVVGDITGFTAATYLRGIPYIQVPTTLLAMIDSSIGGKTAVNTPDGKNLIGAFWQPTAVIADLDCLQTLPENHVLNGWVEALKIFLIRDAQFFHQAISSNEPAHQHIAQAITLKQEIVLQDPHEKNLRAILNFGHTIGHALEALSGYRLLHGHAVAYGMLIESQLSLQRGLITSDEYEIIESALGNLGFQGEFLKHHDVNRVLSLAKHDKKNSQQETRYILLSGIGAAYHVHEQYSHSISDAALRDAWNVVINRRHDGR